MHDERIIAVSKFEGPALAMPPHRVIVVDDEILLRQGLSARLGEAPDLRVVGVCSSGQAILAKLATESTDAIVLDLDMGCSAPLPLLKQIREKFPEVYVISIVPTESFLRRIPPSLTTPGRSEAIVRPRQSTTAEAFLDTLAGMVKRRLTEMLQASDKSKASDFAFVPAVESGSSVRKLPVPSSSPASIRAESPSAFDTREIPVVTIERSRPRSHARVEILAIASSTGGPQALTEVLMGLPVDFPVPIVVVQHMPAEFTRNLAERLDSVCAISVKEAEAGEMLRPGLALIAPGDKHMALRRSDERRPVVTLNQGPMENSCRPAADVLFRSVADLYGASALAVVLTGMGKDGLSGSQVIHDAGGRIIVQDEATSVVWGMPGEVARAGLAETVLPLRELAGEIIRRIGVGRI